MSILSIEMATGFRNLAIEESKRCPRSIHAVVEDGSQEVLVGEPGLRHRVRHARGVLLGSVSPLHAFGDIYANHALRSIVDRQGKITTTLVEGRNSWILEVSAKNARYLIGMDGSSVLVGCVAEGEIKDCPRPFQFEDVAAVYGIITSNGL